MNIIICNEITGEVVGTSVTAGIKQLRGIIRKWMKDGLKYHNFRILEWSSFEVFSHIMEYAKGQQLCTCDICGAKVKHQNMTFHKDAEGVTMFSECNICSTEQYLPYDLELDDDVDDMHPTAEYQGRYTHE